MPFDGRAWETVDQLLLVDVGSRTITQWHCMCESAGGIRESHVFRRESTLLRVPAKDEGEEEKGRTGDEGSRFPGNQIVTSFASAPRDATLLSR